MTSAHIDSPPNPKRATSRKSHQNSVPLAGYHNDPAKSQLKADEEDDPTRGLDRSPTSPIDCLSDTCRQSVISTGDITIHASNTMLSFHDDVMTSSSASTPEESCNGLGNVSVKLFSMNSEKFSIEGHSNDANNQKNPNCSEANKNNQKMQESSSSFLRTDESNPSQHLVTSASATNSAITDKSSGTYGEFPSPTRSHQSKTGCNSGFSHLRQDMLVPYPQKCMTDSSSITEGRNSALFQNIDELFDSCLPAFDELDNDGETNNMVDIDTKELRDICKMCFAAMCVVFSSRNPSTTKIFAMPEEDDGNDTNSSNSTLPSAGTLNSKNTKTNMSTVYQNVMEKDLFKTSIFLRHQRRLAMRGEGINPANGKGSHGSGGDQTQGMKTSSGKSVLSSKSYEIAASLITVGSGASKRDKQHEHISSAIQRPSIPLPVAYMLWSKLISIKIKDRNQEKENSFLSDRMVKSVLKCVKDTLVNKMSMIHTSFQAPTDSSDTISQSVLEINEATECLRINHDLHLQYGLLISEDSSLFSFFLRRSTDDQNGQRYKFPYRIFDADNWNPEHALNFVLASSCLSCVHRAASKANKRPCKSAMRQMQNEYSFEMLPWHLMRAMQYDTVADLLVDVSFVKGRLSCLNFKDSAKMHIADFEELYESITALTAAQPSAVLDIDVDKTMTECYGLLGSLIRSKDVSRWQYEAKNDDDSGGRIEESIDLNHVLSVAESLEALGDSLFRYHKQSESMKYYYKAMVRYEHINAVEMRKMSKVVQPNSESPLFNEKTQLSMGGVLSRIASVYECQSELADAMLCYEKALSFFSKCQSKDHAQRIAKTLASMGELHFNLKEFESAISCFNEALLMLRSMDEDTDEVAANLILVMGNVRREMGDLNEALELLSEALYNKVLLYGKTHPEVGFIHHIIGVAYCDRSDFRNAIAHFENALKIRKATISLVQSQLPPNDKSGRIQSRELEASESLEFIGEVYETMEDLDTAFMYYEESANIYHNHLLDLVAGDASTMMISDIVTALKSDSEVGTYISEIYKHLQAAINIGFQICPVGRIFKSALNVEDLIEIEGQMAEILYDMGMIRGAQYLHQMSGIEVGGDEGNPNITSKEREESKVHFEHSVALRKRRIERIRDFDEDGDEEMIRYERISMAISLYELGKLLSWFVMKDDIEEKEPRRLRFIPPSRNFASRDCHAAIAYFAEAKKILQDSISMAETLAYAHEDEDAFISRLRLTPTIYEEMLQTMAILYRKIEQYDKSVECYNEVSLLLTRMELEDRPDAAPEDFGIHQKEKVAFSSQSIGDILFDTAEFVRALESYDEALKLRRASGCDSLVIADTLTRKGSVLLKLDRWDEAALSFNEALRIRVDILPQDHCDIAESFHFIGKAYEGHEQLEQALDYYKKAQRILSGRLVDTDTKAADLFFDLGQLVLNQEEAASRLSREYPSEDDISLALTCLALCRDIYTRSFGDDVLEVGNALSLLGLIYHKYGEVTKAVSLYKRALTIFRGAPLDQSERIQKTLTRLGTALLDVSPLRKNEVFECYSLAQEVLEKNDGCRTVGYADLIFLNGDAHFQYGNVDKALGCFEDALSLYRTVLGKDHAISSKALMKIGACLIHDRKHEKAMTLLQEAMELLEGSEFYNSFLIADIHFNMGIVHCETGELNKAIDSYEISMRLKRDKLGDESIEIAQILNNIGSVFARNKEYQRALKPWQDAIEIYKSLGVQDEDPKVSCTRGNIEISKVLLSPSPIRNSLRNIDVY